MAATNAAGERQMKQATSHLRTLAELGLVLLLGAMAIVFIVFASGCKAQSMAPVKTEQAINNVGKSTARIEVRADFGTAQAKLLPESAPKTVIVEQFGGIKADASDAAAELDKAQVNIGLMAGTINNQTTEIAVLKAENERLNNLYIGPRLWRVVRWGVAIILGFGFVSTLLGIVSPAGWGMVLSRAINANIMLPFVWMRDLILRMRGLKLAAVPTPVADAMKTKGAP